MTCLVLYCRAGFEKECAAEISARAAALEVPGYAKATPGAAYVVYTPYEPGAAQVLATRLPFHSLIFPRQMFVSPGLCAELPLADRVGPLLGALAPVMGPVQELYVETADTNEAKELQGLCKKITPPLRAAMKTRGLWSEAAPRRAHVFFLSSNAAYPGYVEIANASPWIMGIPRLKFPHEAPSRSTLKLEEALLFFLTPDARAQRLRPGGSAVDLGAAPGGWTWQFVHRHMHCIAVDNGPMAPHLLDSGLVQHLRVDGLTYAPKRPVDWMVCDMVEQPRRIAALVARWVAEGWCRETIFNLKLPMKKRYEEVQLCAGVIDEQLARAGVRYTLAFKQLYHDREEVTGHVFRVS